MHTFCTPQKLCQIFLGERELQNGSKTWEKIILLEKLNYKNCKVVVLVPVIINIQKLNIFYPEKGEISVSWIIKNGFMKKVECQASFNIKEIKRGIVGDGEYEWIKIQKWPKRWPQEWMDLFCEEDKGGANLTEIKYVCWGKWNITLIAKVTSLPRVITAWIM